MRASVSDIVTFRKCPKLWKYRLLWAPKPTSYMERGIIAHRQVQAYLNERMAGKNHTHATTTAMLDVGTTATQPPLKWSQCYNHLDTLLQTYNIVAVERPFEFDFRGHTLLGRPDAVLQNKHLLTDVRLFQIKTVSRKLSAHELSVQQHPYETAYAYAISHFMEITINRTLLMRIAPGSNGSIIPDIEIMDVVLPHKKQREEILESLVYTLDEMDRYAQTHIEEVPTFTNNCVDWNSGAKCPFFSVCRYPSSTEPGTEDFALWNIDPAKDRYHDLGEIYKPGGSGAGGTELPSGNS